MTYPLKFTKNEVKEIHQASVKSIDRLESGGSAIFKVHKQLEKILNIIRGKLENNSVSNPKLTITEDTYNEWKHTLGQTKRHIEENEQVRAYNKLKNFTEQFEEIQNKIIIDNENINI